MVSFGYTINNLLVVISVNRNQSSTLPIKIFFNGEKTNILEGSGTDPVGT